MAVSVPDISSPSELDFVAPGYDQAGVRIKSKHHLDGILGILGVVAASKPDRGEAMRSVQLQRRAVRTAHLQ